MTDPLRFDLHDDSSSIERARNTPVEIVRDPVTDSHLVAFEDSDDVHAVELTRHTDGWRGDCWSLNEEGDRVGRCRGWVHHDGPCAHLWALRSHRARQRLDDADARHSTDIERAVADGGRER